VSSGEGIMKRVTRWRRTRIKHIDNNTSRIKRKVNRHTQINANGTVIHFVRHFVLSERFVVEREEG
jgi:hypothetical protein